MSTLYVDNIYSKTGTAQALDIDSSGRILTPNRPMFKVFRTANTDYAAAQNATKITGWDDDTTAGTVNVNSFWDTTNDKATAPVTGLYLFELRGFIGTGTYGQTWLKMHVNGAGAKGSDFRINRSNSGFGWESVNFFAHLYLEANDYVEFYHKESTQTSYFHASSGNEYSGASGFLIG